MIYLSHYKVILFCLFVLVAGCTHHIPFSENNPAQQDSFYSPSLLNSERIALKFGSYGIGIIKQNHGLRISNLFSLDGNLKTTRTLAVVLYPEILDSIYIEEHKKILDGESIGSTFKSGGWQIDKESIFYGELLPSLHYEDIYELMGKISPSKLAVYLYEFNIIKADSTFKYAVICEIYHPDFLSLEDLRKIYPGVKEDSQNSYIPQVLNKIKSELKTNLIE